MTVNKSLRLVAHLQFTQANAHTKNCRFLSPGQILGPKIKYILALCMRLVFLCCFAISGFAYAQLSISGVVKDNSTQQGIPFASIGIVGTQAGTLTDGNGNFLLTIPHLTDSIHISSIGYNGLSLSANELQSNPRHVFYLKPEAYKLNEVVVDAKNMMYKILGTSNYSKEICSAFIGENANWRGEQAAILVTKKDSTKVLLESFGFYVVKNNYTDSLQFRIMLYEVDEKGYPGNTFLKKPLLFKTNIKQGEVRVDIRDYYITHSTDFFISLECLEEKMEAHKFCFAGSIKVPSFVKTSAFAKWIRVRGGGADLNVKVSYAKP